MDTPIVLHTKEALDIYINPRRQELLRLMQIAGRPVTPKDLSRMMHISSSSVQHHIKKLLQLGVVALHHTEVVRGITARYYWLPPRTVSLGRAPGSADNAQRLAILQNGLSGVISRYADYFTGAQSPPQQAQGTANWGVVRLQEAELQALKELILHFLLEHERPDTPGIPFEYAMLLFPAGETPDA